MARINVYSRPSRDAYDFEEPTRLGWFEDSTLTERIDESQRWDGNNKRGVISGGQVGYEQLLRTSGGRWVRYYNFRNEFNGPEYYEFLTDDEAKNWLLRDGDDEIVEKYFGAIEEERGPGQPEIGGKALLRLGDERLAAVDALAKQAGISRAELVRRLLDEALAARAANLSKEGVDA